ncbi:carbohydrate ABC transporter permease [Kribbella italica]|uniref:Putative chitobiose transport system permease protein n=1 Tax=Kribbella italica TaxID=1540520 RepID=A0A7W9JDA5_9ACTN|nr:carbohydrate ABC transporter permease [Kribbella italica]MBB5839575.1 putative chitobiose transport system permease protein [Kribbella italica]
MATRRTVRRIGLYVLLFAVAALFVGPFLILLSSATKSAAQDVFGFPPDLIPRPPVLDWFKEAWTTVPFARFLVNSLIYVGVTVPIYLIVSALTAYPLARIAFRGRSLFFMLFLSIMFLPGELMLIPRFLVMGQLGLTDTFASVILPAILSSLGIFLLRQAFAQIPDEVVEAARVDGANEFAIFWRIAVPIVAPTLAVLAILGFVSVWNSFIWPMITLTSQSKFPVALGIAYLTGVSGTDVRGLAAGTVISLLPIVVIFLLLQKRILNSMGGAVKG